jgi:hypothetical protein
MGKSLFSLAFATALLALASSEASAFAFVCQADGPAPVRASQRNLHHQLLRSRLLIFPQSEWSLIRPWIRQES